MRHPAPIWIAISLCLTTSGWACKKKAPKPKEKVVRPVGAKPGASVKPAKPGAGVGAVTPSSGGVGAACKAPRPFGQGNCAKGLRCAPAPGGFCTRFCEAPGGCPQGARCVPSPRGGELCAPTCRSDADCRKAQGYRCHRGRRVCVLPGLVAPKLKHCAASPRPKRTFGAARQVTTAAGPGRYHFEPVAALRPDGALAIVYLAGTRTGKPNPMGAAVVGADGKITAAQTLRFGRENHFDPWLARTRDGNMLLVWLGFDGGRAPEKRMLIGLSTSGDGARWSSARPVHDAKADCPKERRGCMDKPMIVVGPAAGAPGKETTYLFYYSQVTEGLRVRRSHDGGKTFASSVAAGAGAYGDARVDAKGVLHLVYVAPRPGARRAHKLGDRKNAVWYTRSRDGARTFSKPVAVSTESEAIPFFFSNPQVVSDAKRGRLYVVYPTGGPDGVWDLRIAVSADGRSWKRRAVHDDTGCASHMVPVAAYDRREGRLHLAWYENRGGAGVVAYARCDATSCASPERVNDKAFAAYVLVRHNPKWLGEYFSLLIDPRRRALHAVWTQTVLEKGKAVARIFHARGKMKP